MSDAWRLEQRLVKATGKGTRDWTKAQKKELLEKCRVKGYDGHHINTVNRNPKLAGDPNNIEFLTEEEHAAVHAAEGGTRAPISGRSLLDRSAEGTLPQIDLQNGRTIGEAVLGGLITALDILEEFDPFHVKGAQ